MADQTLNLKFQVKDDGSIVLDKISQNLNKIEYNTKRVNDSLKVIKFDSIINLGERAFHTAERIYQLGRSVASSLNDIDRMSKIAGISTDTFQKMSYAAKMTDVEVSELAVGIKKLSMGMEDASRGTGEAGKWFNVMGISIKESDGRLKSLDTIMGQIANKFAQWEDGPRKIAIAVDLFGRSGQNLIPYLNQGAEGLKKFYEAAERLGVVLDESVIKKGSELEDKFKTVEARWDSLKKKFIVGAYDIGEAFAKTKSGVLGWLGPFAQAFGLGVDIVGAFKEKGYQEANTAWASEARFKFPTRPKPQPPAAEDDKAAKRLEEEAAASGKYADAIFEDLEKNQMAVVEWNKRVWAERKEVEERGTEAYIQLSKERESAEYEALNAIYEQQVEKDLAWVTNHERAVNRIIEADLEWQETMREAWDATTKYYVQVYEDQQAQIEAIWGTLSRNISDVWNSGMNNILRGAGSMSDKLKDFFKGIADTFISSVSKMITQWVLFGSITGKAESAGGVLTGGLWKGLLGGLGSAFSGIFKFQHGGLVTSPTIGLVGEAGPEAVIPLRNGNVPIEGGGGGQQTFIQIVAMDTISWEDFVRRNPAPVINAVTRDARRKGAMESTIKGYSG